jgi:trans-aconitate methyltransferase
VPSQRWDPVRYAAKAGFVAELGAPVAALLAPAPGEDVLDLGCGDGVLTTLLAASGARLVAVDASPDQVAAARAKGLDARVVDGRALTFERSFDAVFTNAALHWMGDPDAVLAGVRRALRPGGRFVGEMGAAGNVGSVVAALTAALARRGIDAAAVSPWSFAEPADLRRRLMAHGFRVVSLERFPRPTSFEGSVADWLEIFAVAFLDAVEAGDRAAVCEEVARGLAPLPRDGDGRWVVDYVRLRFAAVRDD